MNLHDKYSGKWISPDGKIHARGILSLNKDSVRLDLIGIEGIVPSEPEWQVGEDGVKFQPIDHNTGRLKFDCLVSETSSGITASLFELNMMRAVGNWFGAEHENAYFEFSPSYSVFGSETIDNLHDKRFTNLTVSLDGLSKIISGDRLYKEYHEDGDYIQSFHIGKTGESDKFRVDSLGMSISFYNGVIQNNDLDGVTIKMISNIKIELDNKGSIPEYIKAFHHISKLLDFMYSGELRVIDMKLYTDVVEMELGDVKVYQDFSLVMREGYNPAPESIEYKHIFSFDTLNNKEEVVKNWMEAEESLVKCLSWFLFVWQKGGYLVESQFVDIMSILESLPMEDSAKTYMAKSDFIPFRDKILNLIPSDLSEEAVKAFTGKINQLNARSARSGVATIVGSFWDVISGITKLEEADFVSTLIVNRNSISHNSYDKKKYIFKDLYTLYKLKELAKHLALMAIAEKLGIDQSLIKLNVGRRISQLQFVIHPDEFERL